jgi:hypothetical protein
MTQEERLLRFDEQHLCKVILGDRVSPDKRDAIRSLSANRKYPLLMYQARVVESGYNLAYKLLPEGFPYPDHAAWYKLPDPEHDSPFPSFFPRLRA